MPECAEPRPVAVLPLWRRGEAGQERNADRPGVLRGHPGPVPAGQAREAGAVRKG
ncbi:hypothetical protein [Kitasatospora brasiliensis]|uniref:hypothetical protein n=1 Tax=Kitasatospora brasiliensis TaxID=3058040 RepID=UPI00292E788F|nr:hypothetical protein [Kitasatospora sp. K002]